jgi:hypothetical protein
MRRESYIADLEEHLKSLNVWDPLIKGSLKCYVCQRPVDLNNFGMVFRDDSGCKITCNKLDCVRTVTTTEETSGR